MALGWMRCFYSPMAREAGYIRRKSPCPFVSRKQGGDTMLPAPMLLDLLKEERV